MIFGRLARTIERLERAHADERARLIATICDLAGHPAAAGHYRTDPAPDVPRLVAEPDEYIADPEQEP